MTTVSANERVQAVLELLEGTRTAADVAQRYGCSEEELHAWRDTWLAGAKAGSKPRRDRRWMVLVGVIAAGGLALGSKAALAASCATPGFFSNLGLKYFCADDPALASEVNSNTQVLVGLIEKKLGNSWGSPDAGPSTSGITTPSATVTGPASVQNVTVGSTSNISFGSQTRQMINLFGTQYGVGVQPSTLYFRTGVHFGWYLNGTHVDNVLDPGAGGTELMRLTSTGVLGLRSLKQTDSLTLNVGQQLEVQRLVVESTPATVGQVVPIDQGVLNSICRDDDGCAFTLSMVNWAGDGNVTTRSGHLFLSQSGSNTWRLDNDVSGTDGAAGVEEWSAWDCYFTDAQFSTDSNNGRSDNGAGFGLLNCKGCNYSDTLTTCRMVFKD